MSERGYGHACDPRYCTSTTSHSGLFAHLAGDRGLERLAGLDEARRSTRTGCPPTSRSSPSSSRSGCGRAGDRDDHRRVGPRKVLAPARRAVPRPAGAAHLGARPARRAERRLEEPAPEAQRLDERAGLRRRAANRRPRAARPSRPARRTARPRRGRTRRPGAPSPLVVRARGMPIPPRPARRPAATQCRSVGCRERRGVAVQHEHPGGGIRPGVLEQTGRRTLLGGSDPGRSAPAAEAACCRAPSSRTSLPLVDKPGVARGRTGAPDLPWAHGTLTPHSSRVGDLGSAPGGRRRSRRSHRGRGRTLRRRARRTR